MEEKDSIAITEQNSIVRSAILALVFFFTMCSHYIFKSTVGGIIIKTFTAYGMPWFDLADAFLAIVLVVTLFLLRSYNFTILSFSKWVTYSLCVILVVVSFFGIGEDGGKGTLIVTGLAGNILVFVATYEIWMLVVGSAYKRNWLTLTIVGVGAQLGVFAGATISKHLVTPQIIPWIPSIVGGLYLGVFATLNLCIKKFSCAGTVLDSLLHVKVFKTEMQKTLSQLVKGFTSYIGTLLLLIIVGSVFGRSVNWLIQQQADYKATIKEATGFLASFYQSSAILSLLFQVCVTPLALRLLPNRLGFLMQPVLGMAIVLLMWTKVDTVVSISLLMIFTSLDYTVYNSYKERLWLSVPLINKVYQKAIAALLLPKVASVINAVGVLALASNSIILWESVLLVLSGVWIVVMVQAVKKNKQQEGLDISDLRKSLSNV